ncbi:F-box domain-containing protein [Caenorhabditis elegans]|uniref:F-box domain-containing protein n=1 Tax=Caenorhabditis elegans TaxID=6239 RepID=O45329_CAEEL|nr:F-box domain-containing protein [Caenorhabditis elegans]CAB04070.2 F-box domain-containing protein [Caenorhabditis elegans]|eukprot:NP_507267.2 F-box A protein [Caenorhabditis elegans]
MSEICSKTQHRTIISPTFLDLPLDIFDLILGRLKPMELLKSRDVCKSLRSAVDSFGFRFDSIDFHFQDEHVTIVLQDDGKRELQINAEHFTKSSLRILLKHASALNFYDETMDRYDVIGSFIKILKSEQCIKVKEIKLSRFSFENVLTILPFFDAQELQIIDLLTSVLASHFELITHLSQWKNSKSLNFPRNIDSKEVSHMFHFENFNIKMLNFDTQAAVKMRDDLMRRSTFKSCSIVFNKFESPSNIELAKVFRPDCTGGYKRYRDDTGDDEFAIKYSNDHLYYFSIKCEYGWQYEFTFSVTRLFSDQFPMF